MKIFFLIINLIFSYSLLAQDGIKNRVHNLKNNLQLLEQERTIELMPVPELTGRVVDLTNTLTNFEKEVIEKKLERIEKEKGAQLVVLLVPTTGIESIEEYSIRVVDTWKIGRKGIDDGILLLIAKNDRRLRIEVGYGLEGVITDVVAKRIIQKVIVPEFKEGNFYKGINKGIDAIYTLIHGDDIPIPDKKENNNTSLLIFIGAFLLALFISLMGRPLWAIFVSTIIFSILGFILVELSLALLGIIFALSAFGASIPLRGGSSISSYRSFPTTGSFSGGGFFGGGGSFGGGGASGSW